MMDEVRRGLWSGHPAQSSRQSVPALEFIRAIGARCDVRAEIALFGFIERAGRSQRKKFTNAIVIVHWGPHPGNFPPGNRSASAPRNASSARSRRDLTVESGNVT